MNINELGHHTAFSPEYQNHKLRPRCNNTSVVIPFFWSIPELPVALNQSLCMLLFVSTAASLSRDAQDSSLCHGSFRKGSTFKRGKISALV